MNPVTWLLSRLADAVDDAIDAVIGAMVDAIEAHWKKEEA